MLNYLKTKNWTNIKLNKELLDNNLVDHIEIEGDVVNSKNEYVRKTEEAWPISENRNKFVLKNDYLKAKITKFLNKSILNLKPIKNEIFNTQLENSYKEQEHIKDLYDTMMKNNENKK